jgi:endonuclease YncB( thermonuclease family)
VLSLRACGSGFDGLHAHPWWGSLWAMRWLIVLALLLPMSAAAQQYVVDGDTLKIDGERIRLYGIDAAELHQPCDNGEWRPGPLARDALAAFIGSQVVACWPIIHDRYGRTVARCFAGGQDLGALMVSSGWAWAYVSSSSGKAMHCRTRSRSAMGCAHHHWCQRRDPRRRSPMSRYAPK